MGRKLKRASAALGPVRQSKSNQNLDGFKDTRRAQATLAQPT
jgi:hypothetical protein